MVEIVEQTVIIYIGNAKGGSDVHYITKIDIEKYKCITEDITTDEVIITDERIQHIEEHHPGTFEKIASYLRLALDEPDYILEDGKNSNTGLILKVIEEHEIRFQIVLRIHTSADSKNFKNSIISGWNISEQRWKNYVSNKKILYRKE